MITVGYIETIQRFHPTVRVWTNGDGYDYNSLQHAGGDPIPSQALLDTQRVQLVQELMWREIQAQRDFLKDGGVFVGGKWFHSDQPSRIQQIGLILWGQNMPPNIMWKTMDGSFVQMTPQLALGVFMAVAQLDLQVFAVAEQHRAQMIASSNPGLYDFSNGWPQIYEGQ